MTITPATILAGIKALEQTAENFRQVRELIRDATSLVAAEGAK